MPLFLQNSLNWSLVSFASSEIEVVVDVNVLKARIAVANKVCEAQLVKGAGAWGLKDCWR